MARVGAPHYGNYKITRRIMEFIEEIKPGWFLISEIELGKIIAIAGQDAVTRYTYRYLLSSPPKFKGSKK